MGKGKQKAPRATGWRGFEEFGDEFTHQFGQTTLSGALPPDVLDDCGRFYIKIAACQAARINFFLYT